MRLRMQADLHEARPAPADPLARPILTSDRTALAALMLAAYRGSVDDEGEGPEEAAAEVDRLLAGAYGTFDSACSEVVIRDGTVVSATLVTHFDGRPLIAFSMTAPAWKRRGLARGGLLRVMERLRRAGSPVVALAVTDTNAGARRLYESVGFEEAPHRSKPGA